MRFEVSEEQGASDWLNRSTDDGRSIIQPSFEAELTSATYGAQWVKEKASLMHTIQLQEDDVQKAKKDLTEEQAHVQRLVSKRFLISFRAPS